MLDILTIGDIKLDTFILLPEAHVSCSLDAPECRLCLAYGTKIPVKHISSQIAGTAPNVAIGIARIGKKSGVVSVMGKDGTHDLALKFLKQHNVATEFIRSDKKRESSFAAVLEYQGETTQLVSHASFSYRLPKTVRPRWIHLSEQGDGYQALYQDATRAHKKGVCVSINPGSIQLRERDPMLYQVLRHTAVLFLNTSEAHVLLGKKEETSIHQLMPRLHELGPEYVVVTDGKNGAYAFDGSSLVFAPAFPAKPVEMTGAGDAFSSGFLGAMLYGKDHKTALAWGSVNAASVITFVGPTTGLLPRREIEARLRARPSYRIKTF